MGFFKKLFAKKRDKTIPEIKSISTYADESCRAAEGQTSEPVIFDDDRSYFEAVRADAITGDVEAEMALALCYIEGKGVTADVPRGMHELELVAAKGYVDAMDALAEYYRDGMYGIRKDLTKMAVWLTRGAEAGSFYAMEELASNYAGGKNGFQEDHEAAHLWYYRLYKNGGGSLAKLMYAVGLFNGYPEDPEKQPTNVRLLLEEVEKILDWDILKSEQRVRGESMIKQMADEGYRPAQSALKGIRRIKAEKVVADIIKNIYNNVRA